MDYLRGLISAPSEAEATQILERLTSVHLVAGGLISSGQSHYWWQGKIDRKTYFNISVFTIDRNKQRIIQEVKAIHSDEVPIIAFFRFDDGNPEFLDWIREETGAS